MSDLERKRMLAREASRRFRQKNPEKVREANRLYREANSEKEKLQRQRWRAENPEKSKASNRKSQLKKYGMTPEELEVRSEAQNYLCLICLEKKKLFVDHSHKTGLVRGLLCQGCNLALGALRDSPENAERAAIYLRKAQ